MVTKHHVNWKLKSMESANAPENNDMRYTGVVTVIAQRCQPHKRVNLGVPSRKRRPS